MNWSAHPMALRQGLVSLSECVGFHSTLVQQDTLGWLTERLTNRYVTRRYVTPSGREVTG